jgi:multicomponent Na+:H+ antiporter subunit B
MKKVIEAFLIHFIIFLSAMIILTFFSSKNILICTILTGCFSIFTVVMYLLLDAPDVAMTEAVVGALVTVFSVFAIKALYKSPYDIVSGLNPLLLIITLALALALMMAGTDLPEFGSAVAIANHKTSLYYIQNTKNDINIASVVAAILANYRGYDTLLETLVIVIGGISVALNLESKDLKENKGDIISTKISRFILPVVFLFAFYLQVHGEISPGGGFQAGALVAVGFIVYSMVFAKAIISEVLLKNFAVLGVVVYIATGLVGVFKGGEFLNYGFLLENKLLGQQVGIIVVEFGVGIAVCSTMMLIYNYLASK